MNRRTFLSTPAALAAPAAGSDNTGKRGPFVIGRWMIDTADLHVKDERSAFFRDMAHESPLLKFPHGFPRRGDPVIVHINWDVSIDRGRGKHRPLAKVVLRVSPLRSRLTDNAELHLVETTLEEDALLMRDDELTQQYYCIRLNHTGRWWLVRDDGGFETALTSAMQPAEEIPLLCPPLG